MTDSVDHSAAAQGLSARRDGSSGDGLLRRSWHVLSDLMPFSSSALASLPKNPRGIRERSVRAENVNVQNYGAISLPPGVRVPSKKPTPIRVEGKVWLACERSAFQNASPLSIVSAGNRH